MTTAELSLPDQQQLWEAVLRRDASFNGRFVYAVRSTGIYCRPTCPSRRPSQAQAVFFPAPEEARSEGYRACRRCVPDRPAGNGELIRRVSAYIEGYIEANDALPSLAEVSEAAGVSDARLRRIFREETGITPAQYARARRLERFKALLREGGNVASAAYEAGYGSSGRVYESATEQLGMTPASYRKGGAGAVIRYIVADSALGGLLAAGTASGVCAVKLGDDGDALYAELREEFPAAELRRVEHGDNESAGIADWTGIILEYLEGLRGNIDLPLDVIATAFQGRVWRMLQAIPPGETRTYQQLAEELDHPTASRAVGRACATNPVAPIVPCHRAVRKDGGLAGYRWGLHRKEALLEMERRGQEARRHGANDPSDRTGGTPPSKD